MGTPETSGQSRHQFLRARHNDPSPLLIHRDAALEANTVAGYRTWLHHFKESLDYLIWRGRMVQSRVGDQDDTHEHVEFAIQMMSDVADRLNALVAEPAEGAPVPAAADASHRLLQAVDNFIQQEQVHIAQIPQVGRRTAAVNLIRDAANYFRGSREALQHILQGLTSIQ